MKLRYPAALAAAALAFAQMRSGIDPRPTPLDYPAHAAGGAVSIGAGFVSASDRRKIFGKDWAGSYLFIEVALYPEPGGQLTVAPQDFALRAEGETLRPVDADVVAPYPKTPDAVALNSKVHVETAETIGYEHGPYGRGGVYTDSRVGVGVGDYPTPAGAPALRDPSLDARIGLTEKELPDVKSSRPVAGYLYFPKPKHAPKDGAYELDYYGASGQVRLAISTKKK